MVAMQSPLQESPIPWVLIAHVPLSQHPSLYQRYSEKQAIINTAINNAITSIYGNFSVLY